MAASRKAVLAHQQSKRSRQAEVRAVSASTICPCCATDDRTRPRPLGHLKGETLACRLQAQKAALQPKDAILQAEAAAAARRRTASRTGLCPYAGRPCRRPSPQLPPLACIRFIPRRLETRQAWSFAIVHRSRLWQTMAHCSDRIVITACRL